MLKFKYIIKNVAWVNGKTATFMPKPLFGDNGSGMHTHQSLWKDGEPLFYDEIGYAGLSDMARYYIGGLLHHAPSLLAFTNPTVNSYHRLVPGFEAPVNLVYSAGNRSACIRVPITGTNPKAKRIEFRVPDPSANPYLAFSAMLMAGLDGIQNKIEPPAPVDKDLYELPPDEAASIPQVPGSLSGVLDALEADHEFLTEGGVFTDDLIANWMEYKRVNEIDPIRLRPHPHEFELYYDVLGPSGARACSCSRATTQAYDEGPGSIPGPSSVVGAGDEVAPVDRTPVAVRCSSAAGAERPGSPCAPPAGRLPWPTTIPSACMAPSSRQRPRRSASWTTR